MAETTTLEPSTAHPHIIRRARMAWFIFLLALVNLMWAAQGPLIKILDPYHLNALLIAFVPFYLVTVPLVPVLYYKRRSNPNAPPFTVVDWKQFLIAGVVGQVLSQLGMTWGTTRSTSVNFSILNLLIPVITAVLASLMLRERVTRLQVLCLMAGLCGVLLMSRQDILAGAQAGQVSFVNKNYLVGNVLILAGCIGSAFYNVYCKGLMEKFGEVEILICSYVTASLAGLVVLTALFWRDPASLRTLAHLDWQAWLVLGLLALLVYGISMLMFFYVLKFLPVTVASASVYLIPVFGVILSILLVHERLNLYQALGSVFVLIATIVIMKYDVAPR